MCKEEIKEKFAELIEQKSPIFYQYFQAAGWTWWNTEPRTPSIQQIREALYKALDELPFTADGKPRPEGCVKLGGGYELGYTETDEEGHVELFVAFKDSAEVEINVKVE